MPLSIDRDVLAEEVCLALHFVKVEGVPSAATYRSIRGLARG